MDYTVRKLSAKHAVFSLSGRFDAAVVPELKTALKSTVANGLTMLALDMNGVSFIDSSGLSALVSGFKAAREQGGMLVLANVGDQIRVALELTRLNQIFTIFDDLESAVSYLAKYKG